MLLELVEELTSLLRESKTAVPLAIIPGLAHLDNAFELLLSVAPRTTNISSPATLLVQSSPRF